MSTAVAKNLMADMKLFGMLGAFEQSAESQREWLTWSQTLI
jgi:hypothetical protein